MSGGMPDFVGQDLIRRFKHAAIVAHFGYEDEDIAMQLAGIRAAKRTAHELDALGAGARLALAPFLLDDPDLGVRAFAAGYLLKLIPERALAVLKDVYLRGPSEARLSASDFLESYERGEPNS